jgi:hypothetical protein
LQANPQLSRLFAARETLQPFAWDAARPQTIQEFSRFVSYVEKVVGKSLTPEPRQVEWLYRLHYATEGVVGNLMNLMRFADALSELQDQTQLDLTLLALAFQQRLSKHLPGKVNPFELSAKEVFVPPTSAPVRPEATHPRPRSKSVKSLKR